MKITKLCLLVTAAVGLSLFSAACSSEDQEQADSAFYVGDRSPDANGNGSGNLNPIGNGSGDDANLTVGDDAGIKMQPESDKADGYGDFDPKTEDRDYIEGFGKRILDADAVMQPVQFAFDTFSVPSSETEKVNAVVNYLKSHNGTGVVVEGHCDNRGTEEYNQSLGERRAISVKDAIKDAGISEDRLRTNSFGELRPIAPGNDEDSWMKNRRAEFILVKMGK